MSSTSSISTSSESTVPYFYFTGWVSSVYWSSPALRQILQLRMVQSTGSEEKVLQEAREAHAFWGGEACQGRADGGSTAGLYSSALVYSWLLLWLLLSCLLLTENMIINTLVITTLLVIMRIAEQWFSGDFTIPLSFLRCFNWCMHCCLFGTRPAVLK